MGKEDAVLKSNRQRGPLYRGQGGRIGGKEEKKTCYGLKSSLRAPKRYCPLRTL